MSDKFLCWAFEYTKLCFFVAAESEQETEISNSIEEFILR